MIKNHILSSLIYFIILIAVISFIFIGCNHESCTNIKESQEIFFASIFTNFLPKLFLIILLFFVFKIGFGLIIELLVSRLIKKLNDSDTSNTILKLIKFSWWLIFSLVSIVILVGNLSTLVTSLGLIGLGLTFALQKPITNFVGWLTITFKGIYKEGDRIQIGNIRGDVRDVQLMNTIIDSLLESSHTKDRTVVTFPNELILTSEVKNFTKDENYIMEEIKITITYESNYVKGIKLLRDIITDLIKTNKKRYIKKAKHRRIALYNLLGDFHLKKLKLGDSTIKQKINFGDNYKIEDIEIEKRKIDEKLEELSELEEEFKPNVRVELLDSSIELIGQFLTPYDEVKKNRTSINLAFLESIKKEEDIEVAYPHMQIVYDKK